MDKKKTATPKDNFRAARFFLRCNAGSWSRAFDMACLNGDYDALPMLNAAQKAYDQRHDRDPLHRSSVTFHRALRAAQAKAGAA